MIRFDHVTKTYAPSAPPALDDVSLEVQRGEFVFVVGKSGSGKSTLMRIALREQLATKGQVMVAGHDLKGMTQRQVPRLRREMGAVFQDFRLLPGKTVSQNVAFALQVIGKPRHVIRTLVPETLEMVGLADKGKRLPHELSGGEQQRVAIARAVVNKPQILLADEPTGNLDPVTSLDIVHLLQRINRAGTTVLMATHDSAIVNELRQRVIELRDGHVVRDEEQATYNPDQGPDAADRHDIERGAPEATERDETYAAGAAATAGAGALADAPALGPSGGVLPESVIWEPEAEDEFGAGVEGRS